MRRQFCVFSLLSCISWLGCVGTEVGNPADDRESEVTFEFAAVAPAPNALTLANGLDVNRALLGVEELGLRPAATCDGSDRIDFEIPFSVDVVSGETQPEFGALLRPATRYCRLEIELIPGEEVTAGLPSELDGRTVFVDGALADGTPFEIILRESDNIEIDGEFALTAGSDSLIVGFDLESWVDPADLETLEPDVDGVIRIDDETDEDGFAAEIQDNIVDSVTLFRDTNENGMLDPGTDEIIGLSGESGEEEEL